MSDYGAVLTFDGDPERAQFLDETPRVLTLSPDTSEARCVACGEPLRWLEGRWLDEDNNLGHCRESTPPTGPHIPERLAFAWLNDATIQLEPNDGGATEWAEVSITVPQGTVRLRVECAMTSGQLVVHMTGPGQGDAPPLTTVSSGGYLIQAPTPT
jgi:hypothetical protein